MYIEITREAFETLVPQDLPVASVKSGSLYRRIFYISNGVKLQRLENYPSGECVTQYYIQDINA